MKVRKYGLGLLVATCVFVFANMIDYLRYRRLIPGYDYLIGYGLPFEFFVKGGTLDVERRILWPAVAGNLVAILVLAAVLSWVVNLRRNRRGTT
jgi:hypothetical protein